MSEHTPGPWFVSDDFDRSGEIHSLYGDIAEVNGWQEPDDETESNARLIAAAPDLLDRLDELVAAVIDSGLIQYTNDNPGRFGDVLDSLDNASAAIQKATQGD